MNTIRNTDESRLPERDSEGRVPVRDCAVVQVSLMLPPGQSAEAVRALLERLYEREPLVLHWSTNWFDAR